MEQIKRRRLSAKERKQVFDMCNGHCAYCGTEITFRGMQIEHKKPLRLNGSDTLENMLPACRSCNHYKHTLDVEGFREYLAGIPKRLVRDDVAYQVALRFGIVEVKEQDIVFYFEKMRCDNDSQ